MNKYTVLENGVSRPMTPKEIAEYKRMEAEMPVPEKSDSERIAELEEALNALLERRVQ